MDSLVNFGYTLVATAPSPATSGTSLVVTAGDGALLPAAPFDLTLYAVGTQPLASNAEIVRCTAKSTDTLTITRAQYGTTAQSVAVGWAVDNAVTANLLSQLMAVSTYDLAGVAQQLQPSAWMNMGGKNAIINGGMYIWQRGTSFAIVNGSVQYTTDRFAAYSYAASSVWTVSQVVSSLTGTKYALKSQRTSGSTDVGGYSVSHAIETLNALAFAGQIVTLSFFAKCGANFSPTSSLMSVQIRAGTGTDQNPISGYAGGSTPLSTTATLTTTMQRFTYTVTLSSTITELGVVFPVSVVGTAGADDSFQVTGVQLELGSVATPFSRAGGSIGGELALCQRYYYQISSTSSVPYAPTSNQTTTSANALIPFPVTMRVAPSFTSSTATLFSVFSLNGAVAASTLAAVTTGPNNGSITVTTGLIVAGHAGYLESNSTTATFIAFSAEL